MGWRGAGGKDLGAFLFPPSYNTQRTYAFPRPDDPNTIWTEKLRYTFADIMELAKKFHELIKPLQQLQMDLRELVKTSPSEEFVGR